MVQWLIVVTMGVWVWGRVCMGVLQCGKCIGGYNELICPDLQDNHRLVLTVSDHRKAPESVLNIRCRATSPYLNASLLQGCNFTSIRYVYFKFCPLLAKPFSEVLEEMGVEPTEVITLSFSNAGQRTDLTLRSDHLQGLTSLKNVEFKENHFTEIPANLFEATPSLQFFLIILNTLEEIPETLFAKTPNLTDLSLRGNGLITLPHDLLADLPNLTTLSLYGNKLTELHPQLLAKVPALSSLDLSFNNLTFLPSTLFTNMSNLTKLMLSSNNIKQLPEDLFHSCPNLNTFHVTHNKLTSLPSALFNKSKNLTKFDFESNQITTLPEDLFRGLQDIIILKMRKNGLKSLPNNIFTDLVNLKVLDLQSNLLEALPPNCFINQRKMDKLILHNNSLLELPDHIFQNCESLMMLYLSHNNLNTLLASSFPEPNSVLKTLFLSHNNLSFSTHSDHLVIQKHFPLSSQTSLQDIRLDNNRISTMPSALTVLFPNLALLDLSANNIDFLDENDLSFMSDRIEINLKNNIIKSLTLYSPEVAWSGKLVKVHLAGNPLICDCHLYQLAKLMQKKQKEDFIASGKKSTRNQHLTVQDDQQVMCSQDTGVHIKVLDVNIGALTCPVLECIGPCTCSTRPDDQMFIIDCSHQGLQAVPQMHLFSAHQLTGNSSLSLYLHNNNLTNPEGVQEYKTLVNLTDNSIAFVNESFLPRSLKVLDMRRNQLGFLQVSLLKFLKATNATLSLGGNPWVCDCQLLPLFSFLRDPARNVTDAPNMACRDLQVPLVKVLEEDLCPVIQQPMVIVTIASTTVVLFLFFILGTASVYRYQQDIKVWLFTHRLCLWAVAEEEQDTNKRYDAFISYSNKDEEFVNSVLVPGLESGDPKYRICLHYRDWTPGEYIQNQIDQSIEASRRTIVVLSNNFIENVWGQIEFKTAHSKALKDKTNRIIVIVFGEIPPESQMDEELKLYLSTRTYMQWRDPKFWEKLRYAMPHPQQFVYKKPRQLKTEKLELEANSKPCV